MGHACCYFIPYIERAEPICHGIGDVRNIAWTKVSLYVTWRNQSVRHILGDRSGYPAVFNYCCNPMKIAYGLSKPEPDQPILFHLDKYNFRSMMLIEPPVAWRVGSYRSTAEIGRLDVATIGFRGQSSFGRNWGAANRILLVINYRVAMNYRWRRGKCLVAVWHHNQWCVSKTKYHYWDLAYKNKPRTMIE